jgi:hypothetical protein
MSGCSVDCHAPRVVPALIDVMTEIHAACDVVFTDLARWINPIVRGEMQDCDGSRRVEAA